MMPLTGPPSLGWWLVRAMVRSGPVHPIPPLSKRKPPKENWSLLHTRHAKGCSNFTASSFPDTYGRRNGIMFAELQKRAPGIAVQ